MDKSETSVGVILSQQLGKKQKKHPIAFFSHKRSSTERNHDIGYREFLAVRLIDIEGAPKPFTVLTDHKNLAYCQESKSTPDQMDAILHPFYY